MLALVGLEDVRVFGFVLSCWWCSRGRSGWLFWVLGLHLTNAVDHFLDKVFYLGLRQLTLQEVKWVALLKIRQHLIWV